ncbi:Arc family DNA binding domain-containing protein [Elizabethkingia anophelis]|nr:Arc family DNA binding domain-containing protein [Elizabethkingia anophelis]
MQKKSFVLRIDEETYKLIEKWASDEFRSVNGQIEYVVHQALIKSRTEKKKKDNEKAVRKSK